MLTTVALCSPQKRLALRRDLPYRVGDYTVKRKIVSHIAKEKTKLLNRLKRLRGQIEAIERAVGADLECVKILQQATSCRGALDGFIAEVIEDHIREHVVDRSKPSDDPHSQAADELIEIVHAYIT